MCQIRNYIISNDNSKTTNYDNSNNKLYLYDRLQQNTKGI